MHPKTAKMHYLCGIMTDISMFANRLAKMYKHTAKWARRQEISCFRIYDADVPQFPFAIDRYEDFLYVTEYQTDYPVSAEDYLEWLGGCLQAMAVVTEISIDNIFMKKRKRQKGTNQYEKNSDESFKTTVTENGLKFIINLSDYLDAGLFLDHRNTRLLVRESAAGKRVLNLFAYTGSFSVYAAAAGASHVSTIDLSNTYLAWAKENMELNGLYEESKHEFIQADVLEWLEKPPYRAQFDIIVLDPPTFSNSKRMLDVLDVQRDHVAMINYCLRLLGKDGVLYFSTNSRKFTLETERIYTKNIKEITAQTIPNDFRDKKIHKCFKIGV
jgi:23S rRNA (cytosine1962-C5)-methyltransferase